MRVSRIPVPCPSKVPKVAGIAAPPDCKQPTAADVMRGQSKAELQAQIAELRAKLARAKEAEKKQEVAPKEAEEKQEVAPKEAEEKQEVAPKEVCDPEKVAAMRARAAELRAKIHQKKLLVL